MSEHLLHIFIYGILIILNLFMVFRRKLKINSNFGVLVLVILMVFVYHLGVENVFAFHHLGQMQDHSCCVPQPVDSPQVVSFSLENKDLSDKSDHNVNFITYERAYTLNNKSPPLFS